MTMSDSYRPLQHLQLTPNHDRHLRQPVQRVRRPSKSTPLHQTEIEALTDEEYCYFLGHGSLDTDAEVY